MCWVFVKRLRNMDDKGPSGSQLWKFAAPLYAKYGPGVKSAKRHGKRNWATGSFQEMKRGQ